MQLWKKLFNVIITGNNSRVQSGSTLTAESGSTVNLAGTWQVGGTSVTATASELNTSVHGLTATSAQINRATNPSTRIVTTTATALSLTVTQHGSGVLLVNTNSTVANTFKLPAATGSGEKFTIINNITQTQGSVVVQSASTTDVIAGVAYMFASTTSGAEAFVTTASSTKVTFNITTTGGLGGDQVEAWDSAAGTYTVRVMARGSGTLATPFG